MCEISTRWRAKAGEATDSCRNEESSCEPEADTFFSPGDIERSSEVVWKDIEQALKEKETPTYLTPRITCEIIVWRTEQNRCDRRRVERFPGRTFEDRCYLIVIITWCNSERGSEDAIIADDHNGDADVAVARSDRETRRPTKAKTHRMRKKRTQPRLNRVGHRLAPNDETKYLGRRISDWLR